MARPRNSVKAKTGDDVASSAPSSPATPATRKATGRKGRKPRAKDGVADEKKKLKQQQKQQARKEDGVSEKESLDESEEDELDYELDVFLLPGVLSQSVDTWEAVRGIMACAAAAAAGALTARVFFDWIASGEMLGWDAWLAYMRTVALPSFLSAVTALAMRIVKLGLTWGSVTNMVALDVLAYAPLVYLFSSFYGIAPSAALSSAAIDLVADVLPILAWKQFVVDVAVDEGAINEDEAVALEMEELATESAVLRDPVTFSLSSAFAAVLYGFTFVQACRFFLPTTFVLHFLDIATVEPARVLPLSTLPTSLSDVGSAIFLSWPGFLLNVLCGTAARSFLFSDADVPSPYSLFYRPVVAIRTAALSLAVGLNVFLQCYLNIQGVDGVGAMAYASIWTVAPVLVGLCLGLAGV